ncbi:MAG: hypothetical protein ACN4GG_02135 [Akkermansiaceae bacterium]
MKLSYIAPPAIALIASGIWLGLQHQEITDLVHKTSMINERIEVVNRGSQASHSSEADEKAADLPKELLLENGSLDWAALARFMTNNHGNGMPKNIRTMIKLEQKLMELEVSDIKKALKLIKRLQLSAPQREALQNTIGRVFIQKEPKTALAYFEDNLNDDHSALTWMLREAVGKWAKEEPLAALAWFDEQKAKGAFEATKLDPNAGAENEYASQIYSALLLSDPAQVDARLSILPDREKERLLQNAALWSGTPEKENAYFDLVRRNLGEGQQAQIIGGALVLPLMRGGDLDAVSEKLSSAKISDTERQAGIEKVSQHFARPWNRSAFDLKETYAWFGKEAPDQQLELTAKTYAHYGNHRNTNFEATFQEVSALAAETGNPELLIHFANGLERREEQLNSIKDEGLKSSLSEIIHNLPE